MNSTIPLPLHHIGYITRNLKKSQKLYESLGFVAEGGAVADAVQNNCIQFMVHAESQLRIELIEPQENSTVSGQPEGLHHFCFDASQIENFPVWFREQKLGKIFLRVVSAPAIGGRSVCFACLRDGSFVEFILATTSAD